MRDALGVVQFGDGGREGGEGGDFAVGKNPVRLAKMVNGYDLFQGLVLTGLDNPELWKRFGGGGGLLTRLRIDWGQSDRRRGSDSCRLERHPR